VSKRATETTIERNELQGPVPDAEPRRELAHRVSGGIEITLYWSAEDNSTSVEVWHPASEQTLRFGVALERALDAFYHPFSQLPISVDFEAG
jgi:hypothetical protein